MSDQTEKWTDMTTCDACGRKYAFTNYRKDRCPYCCPKDTPLEDDYDYDQSVEDEEA